MASAGSPTERGLATLYEAQTRSECFVVQASQVRKMKKVNLKCNTYDFKNIPSIFHKTAPKTSIFYLFRKLQMAGVSHNGFNYSEKYNDDTYEYRHVSIPKDKIKYVPQDRCMTEREWRDLGVQQSLGWVHYMIHKPEPHVLMFRRELPK